MPTPSMTAKRIPQLIAPFRIARAPPRTANEPPVKKPAMMAFQGSSFRRMPLTAQSVCETVSKMVAEVERTALEGMPATHQMLRRDHPTRQSFLRELELEP